MLDWSWAWSNQRRACYCPCATAGTTRNRHRREASCGSCSRTRETSPGAGSAWGHTWWKAHCCHGDWDSPCHRRCCVCVPTGRRAQCPSGTARPAAWTRPWTVASFPWRRWRFGRWARGRPRHRPEGLCAPTAKRKENNLSCIHSDSVAI